MNAMNIAELEQQLEAETVALNRLLYADGIGLPVAPEAWDAPTARQAELAEALLVNAEGDLRHYAIETWVEARRLPLDNRFVALMDEVLNFPELPVAGAHLTWRNWKQFEREAPDEAMLSRGFDAMLARSSELTPMLEQRASQLRADYGRFKVTPADLFARREGTTPQALRTLRMRRGTAGRPAFAVAVNEMSQAGFGRAAGPAELRALYLNRLFEPGVDLFEAEGAVEVSLQEFARLGFDLSEVSVDVDERPKKYPGAFCLPVRIPDDVRVSVRMASAHHLVDMLYHELGHAAHFSGIRASLPFVDRYWIHSGTHETFSTLFERLLDQPLFLSERLGFEAESVARLVAFGRFKLLLTFAWLGASGLTALDAWLENLPWREVELRYAENMLAFTGVAVPPEFARLEPFTASLAVYPAGYVIANLRVWHWLRELEGLGGPRWWESPLARANIVSRIEAGGQVRFPQGWWDADGLVAELSP
jgi:hypothetical protein